MFQEKLLILFSEIKENWLAAILGGVGILLVLVGLAFMISSRRGEENITFEPSLQASPSAQIFVDIGGAVVRPGVYQLNSNARLQDGLIAAGGLSAGADRDWIARNLNLAKKLADGTKIYIPSMGEAVKSSSTTQGSSQVGTANIIDINTASLSELDRLPGVGPVTGQKIIDNRPYSDINELLMKKVVGQKVFEQIKDKINIY